jgi:uncharacterized protein
MQFPVAPVPMSSWGVLVAIGFVAGVCGGFWGMGGGWIVIPVLVAIGVPINVAVGTSITNIFGLFVVSTFRHWRFGNLSVKITAALIPTQALGVEVGTRSLEYLKGAGEGCMDIVISVLYMIVLFGLAAFIDRDIFRTIRRRTKRRTVNEHAADMEGDAQEPDDIISSRLPARVQSCRFYPCISCDVAGISHISVWAIGLVGMTMGVMTGLLGVGGGFIGMPMLVYMIGCPTHVAVGTSMFSAIVAAAFGAFRHAMHGNVDLLMAVFLLAGASIGAQIGAFATRHASGTVIRGLFSAMAVLAGISVFLNGFLQLHKLALVTVLGGASLVCVFVMYLLIADTKAARRQMRGSNSP